MKEVGGSGKQYYKPPSLSAASKWPGGSMVIWMMDDDKIAGILKEGDGDGDDGDDDDDEPCTSFWCVR